MSWCVLNIRVIQCIHFKKQLNKWKLMRQGRFMKNFRFNNIATLLRNHKNNRDTNCARSFIGKSAVIKYHELLSKVSSINRKSLFDQLATASSSPLRYCVIRVLSVVLSLTTTNRFAYHLLPRVCNQWLSCRRDGILHVLYIA